MSFCFKLGTDALVCAALFVYSLPIVKCCSLLWLRNQNSVDPFGSFAVYFFLTFLYFSLNMRRFAFPSPWFWMVLKRTMVVVCLLGPEEMLVFPV